MDFGFPAMLTLILLSGEKVFLLQTLLVCILHECGHGIAMCLTGAGLRELRFCGAGLQMTAGTAILSHPRQLCISLAGPAVNLLCAALLWKIAAQSALLHLCMGMFNLLPYRSLDGGTALRIYRHPPLVLCLLLSGLLLCLLLLFRIRNPLCFLMLIYLTINESLR